MKKVYLRFLFAGTPHHLDVIVSESVALGIVQQWDDYHSNRSHRFVKGHDLEQDRHWGVDLQQVACIFTTDKQRMDQLLQQAQQQGARPSLPPNYGHLSGN